MNRPPDTNAALFVPGKPASLNDVKVMERTLEDRGRRLELAQRAFQEFYAQCFWSYRQDATITEDDIPWIIRELRHYGGAKGYQMVAEICR